MSATERRSLGVLLRALADESPDTSAMGDAFEYVTDLALWSSPEFGARIKQIWRWEDWPDAEDRDLGIDRVVSTVDGELWAVQARGYAASTSVTYSGIATFLAAAATGQFALSLLVTSTDSIADNARKIARRQSVPTRILDRSWLESLDIDWPADLAGLREAVKSASSGRGPAETARAAARHELLPHQQAAVEDALAEFAKQAEQRDDVRAKLLMPCGTGKTLTCHAVAEQLGARQILVLVPSLALLAQTMRAWQAQSRGRLRVIAVCSDESVAAASTDDIVVEPSELLAPVTTDSNALADFLKGKNPMPEDKPWPTVVFSTYHSSPVVAAAQKLIAGTRGHSFDLLVADEAHYLAGNVSRDFATALDATKLQARRRLFATATPRIISTALKDTLAKDGRDHHVVSMDDPAVFGHVAHELRFSQALADKLLTDYRVLVLGVDDADVAHMIDQRELLKLQSGNEIITDAASLAAAVAVYRTVTEHDAARLVSYHSRISGAEKFARLLDGIPQWLPPRLRTKHLSAYAVKGTMPTGKRRQILKRLVFDTMRSDGACLVANARCLTEGVDIPTLDGVVFVDPRRSRIDVVQSVGRAIRRAENKTRGLVVIPVSLNRDDDAETALSSGAFSRVWEVLGALRDHDDSLAEELDALRTSLGRRGRIEREALPKILLDLPNWVTGEFAQAIRLKMVERTTSSFYYNLGLLQAFVAREGHARVPSDHVEDGINLGRWVVTQRQFKSKDRLSDDRRAQLEALPGWSWDSRADKWAENLTALDNFAKREGHANVRADHIENGVRLGDWVHTQRKSRTALTAERIAQLEAIPGWTWDHQGDRWNQCYAALQKFVDREADIRVPKGSTEDGVNLYAWVSEQRANKDALSPERRARLEALPGWSWRVKADTWDQKFALLQQFAEREGHARVPYSHIEDGVALGVWVKARRGEKNSLSAERRTKLEALPGWTWDSRAHGWAEKLALLHNFVEREGHARVPYNHVESGFALGYWAADQRGKRSKTMTVERRAQLEAMPGWSWGSYRDQGWDQSYAALETFAEREGHARVPRRHNENGISLGLWVTEQRAKEETLAEERRTKLEALPGWTWDPRADDWDRGYAALKTFTERTGQALAPQGYSENGVYLGTWIMVQRRNKDKLTPQRIEQLEALPGWTWRSDSLTRARMLSSSVGTT